jgi:hypothetical protein
MRAIHGNAPHGGDLETEIAEDRLRRRAHLVGN